MSQSNEKVAWTNGVMRSFVTKLPEDTVTRNEGINAFREIRRQLADIPEMSLDEINAEIAEMRAERKAKNI